MSIREWKITPFFISIAAILAVTVTVCICVASCRSAKISFKTTYYFVCYAMEENSLSASSISSAVSSYGGAGYILEHNGVYYVTVSCYYNERDAKSVCQSLQGRNLNCSVLEISTDEYVLKSSAAKKNAKLYQGNLNTLNSLSVLAYDCANALDTGAYGQSSAKSVISDVKQGLNGLLNANTDNCFSTELRRLIAVCDDCSEGFIYSKDLRKLQIAIADTVINIELF